MNGTFEMFYCCFSRQSGLARPSASSSSYSPQRRPVAAASRKGGRNAAGREIEGKYVHGFSDVSVAGYSLTRRKLKCRIGIRMDADRFLTDIISTLSSSPDFRTSIDNLAQLATRGLADWCGIYAFENEHAIRRLAVAPMPQLETLFPLDLHALTGPAQVRRTGELQLIADPAGKVAEGSRHEV